MSTLHVENLKGPTSGANANKIIVPSGQTFVGSVGQIVKRSSRSYMNTAEGTTSTSFLNATGGSIDFACDYSDSTVLIYVQLQVSGKGALRLTAGGSDITGATNAYVFYDSTTQSNWNSGSVRSLMSYNEVHAPASTNSVTYALQYRAYAANVANAFGINELFANANWSYIECVEIKA
jgi:hypothetical protein